MTPTAVTPAARTKRPGADPAEKAARSASPRPSSPHPATPRGGHRAPLARPSAPRTPRRVSGPAAPAPRSSQRAAPARAAPAPAPRTARRAPRRTDAQIPFSLRAVARLRSLPDHSLLDRVVRGRLWIPLLGVLLAGIVAAQVEVLKLNASIGQSVVKATSLQGENAQLRAEVSRLSDPQRLEREAVGLGMTMPPATQPLYLSGTPAADLQSALANIHSPDPTAFAAAAVQRAAARAAAVISSSGR